jgi:hypothetical protein
MMKTMTVRVIDGAGQNDPIEVQLPSDHQFTRDEYLELEFKEKGTKGKAGVTTPCTITTNMGGLIHRVIRKLAVDKDSGVAVMCVDIILNNTTYRKAHD